jgi:hypothetical protein
MKIILKLAVVASVAILTLTSCSSGDNPASLNQTSEIEQTMSSFYAKSIETAPEARKSVTNASAQLEEVVSVEDNDVLKSSHDIFSKLENISSEGQTKVADFYKKRNPVDEYYSFEGLNNAQVAAVSLLSLITTALYADPEVANDSKGIDKDHFTIIDDTHASVRFNPEPSIGGSKYDTYLVKTDAGWKIDGKKTYDQYVAVTKK